jgi:hypothetical protein
MHALIEQRSSHTIQSSQPMPLAANRRSDMPNTIRTTPITARTRFALLALGAISLSSLTLPAMAGDDAPDAGTNNPSNCRDLVNHKCLTKPRDDQSGRNQDSRNQDKAAQARENAREDSIAGLVNSVGIARYDSSGRITRVDYPKLGFSDRSYGDEAIIRVYRNGQQKLVWVTGRGNPANFGGKGAMAGHTGSRIAPAPTRTSASAAPPKAATPKSTTTDKATNTTTRDYRTGATAAPGGPPPAAAIGSSTKATPEQLAAQSGGTRDHRRK